MTALPWSRQMAAALVLMLLAGCNSTYPYLPGGGKTAAPPGGTPPATAPAPVPAVPQGDAAQQLQALEARVQQLEQRLAGLEQRQAAPPGGAPEKTVAAGPERRSPTAPAAPAPGRGPQEKAYEDGLRLYRNKKYSAAREKFSLYLQYQPQGGKASEARFFLADSFFQEKKYREAALEFHKLVGQHPQSFRAPSALWRQALAYQHLQQKQNYRNTLKKLVKDHPQSPEAREAEKRLKSEGR